jgi:hypothetical protein
MAGLKDNGFGNEVALLMDAITGANPQPMVKEASANADAIDDVTRVVVASSTEKLNGILSKVASIADSLATMNFSQSEFLADALIETIHKEAAPTVKKEEEKKKAEERVKLLQKELKDQRGKKPQTAATKKAIEVLEKQLETAEKKAK